MEEVPLQILGCRGAGRNLLMVGAEVLILSAALGLSRRTLLFSGSGPWASL